MDKIISWLTFSQFKGLRTYIIALVWAAVVFGNTVGWIDEHTKTVIESFLLPLGLASLRAGLK